MTPQMETVWLMKHHQSAQGPGLSQMPDSGISKTFLEFEVGGEAGMQHRASVEPPSCVLTPSCV